MANFLPLKNYMFYCMQKMLNAHPIGAPFLDIGCGIGDVSVYLAQKGWQGKAIDYSSLAIERAQKNLASYPQVVVEQRPLEQEAGQYGTIVMWDVLEHIEDDLAAMKKIETLLVPGGFLCIAVPSNPVEWRWDDEFYGHYRRYSLDDARRKGLDAGLELVEAWDFTFPIFWLMRRLYTRLKSAPAHEGDSKTKRTQVSSTVNAWDFPILSALLNVTTVLWAPIYWMQFRLFRRTVGRGHEMFVLYRKPTNTRIKP